MGDQSSHASSSLFSLPLLDQDKDPLQVDLLERRQALTEALARSPYDLILYLERAVVHSNLAYPDLAAGDAYRALLLVDEVRDEGFEYHARARQALDAYSADPGNLPDALRHGSLADGPAGMVNGHAPQGLEDYHQLAALASVRCFQILSLSLLLCGCLRSALDFCDKGLASMPDNKDLKETREYVEQVARGRLHKAPHEPISIDMLPERGLVRREIYPWNTHEPDRLSDESLAFLNGKLAAIAPKCAVRVSPLPVLLEGESSTDGYDIIPTCNQLGLFAREDIAPGEVVLREFSLLTANNRYKEPLCDACGAELAADKAVSCPDCHDTVFCDGFCAEQARAQYHPAVCDRDIDAIAQDPADPREADEALYVLLLTRLLAMATHQCAHPLDLTVVKYIWGDFVPTHFNDIDLSPGAGPPPEWTLPFSFRYNIAVPLHALEKMDVDVFADLDRTDVWVFNTALAKFRGTASARKNYGRRGVPDVAAVHPFWCLANHDCNPNVTWEWGGRMVLSAGQTRLRGGGGGSGGGGGGGCHGDGDGNERPWGGIRAGEEILNHYCDISLPVQQRREWARGSLGGWCMCRRCRDEKAAERRNNLKGGGRGGRGGEVGVWEDEMIN